LTTPGLRLLNTGVTGSRRRDVTDHDVAIVEEIVRWGALTVEQLCDCFMAASFPAKSTAYGRMKVLVDLGYVRPVQPFPNARQGFSLGILRGRHRRLEFSRATIYLPTWTGTRLARERPLSPPGLQTRKQLRALSDLMLAIDLARWLLAREAPAKWITSRQLLRDTMGSVRASTGRLTHGPGHVPAGVLVPPDGRRIAIEMQVFARTARTYERIVRWYARQPQFNSVRWYARTSTFEDAPLRELILQHKLTDVIELLPIPLELLEQPGSWWKSVEPLLRWG
jgi:hypothetical protein